LYRDLKGCLDVIEPIDGKPLEEVVGFVFWITVPHFDTLVDLDAIMGFLCKHILFRLKG